MSNTQTTLAIKAIYSNNSTINITRFIAAAIIGSLILWASAKIQIPFWPVPMTMQTFAIITIALMCGSKLALATVTLYLIEGATGIPVFAGTPERGIGLAYMMGPTGGYLIGFILTAAICGYLADIGYDKGILKPIATAILGITIIYAAGITWLGSIIGWDKPILELGLYPFILGDAIKVIIAALLLPATWQFVNKINKK